MALRPTLRTTPPLTTRHLGKRKHDATVRMACQVQEGLIGGMLLSNIDCCPCTYTHGLGPAPADHLPLAVHVGPRVAVHSAWFFAVKKYKLAPRGTLDAFVRHAIGLRWKYELAPMLSACNTVSNVAWTNNHASGGPIQTTAHAEDSEAAANIESDIANTEMRMHGGLQERVAEYCSEAA
jgi:hypothetical protein